MPKSDYSSQVPCVIKVETLPDKTDQEKLTISESENPQRHDSNQHAVPSTEGEKRCLKSYRSRIKPVHAALLQDPFKIPIALSRSKTRVIARPRFSVAAGLGKAPLGHTSRKPTTSVSSQSHSSDSVEPKKDAAESNGNRSNLAKASSEPCTSTMLSRKFKHKKELRRRISQKSVPNMLVKPKSKSQRRQTNVSTLGVGLKNKSLINGLWADLFMITAVYTRCNSTSFKEFLHLCQEKKIMNIFRGFRSLSRLLEFTEIAIWRCRDMWLEEIPLKGQVSWFYLLCVFVLYQPRVLLEFDERVLKIRVTEGDFRNIKQFLHGAQSNEFTDVLTLFKLMYGKGAFLFCFTHSTYGLESPFIQSFLKDTEKTKYLYQDVPFPRLTVSLQPCKNQLEEALKEYFAMKSSLLEITCPANLEILTELLGNIGPDFVTELFGPLASSAPEPDGTSSPSEVKPV